VGKFEKGKSGNPGGRPRMPDEVRNACQRLAKESLVMLGKIIRDKAAKNTDRIAAAKIVIEYGYGKPVQPIGGEGEGGPLVVKVLTLTSPDEAETPPPPQIPPPVA
jgi:hypothetical protein